MPSIEYVSAKDIYIERETVRKPLLNMHHHSTYELYHLVKGQREYFIEDRFFMVSEGDFVLIPRNVFHRTQGEGGLRYLVHFSDSFLRRFFTEETVKGLLGQIPFVFRAESGLQEQLQELLSQLLAEYDREKQNPDELKLSGYLYRILFLMANGTNLYVPHAYTDERITGIIQYVNENYNRITDISQVAEHFFISKYHLCRFFRKNLGIPLMTYLNTIKITEACNKMQQGCSNMTQIALDCGFNSSSYFCKVFKKERGISPSEYRRKHR